MSERDKGTGLVAPPRPPNRLAAALKDDVNKVGLAAIAAAWLGTGLLAVPFVGLAVEAAYLMFVPESSWFHKRLSARHRAAEAAYRARLQEQVLPLAGPHYQHAFEAMLGTRDAIEKGVDAGDDTSKEMLRQLDYLLEKYLLYTYQIVQYQLYLGRLLGERGRVYGTDEIAARLIQQVDEQLDRLGTQLKRAADDRERDVVEENISVLQKKRALIQRIADQSRNLALHLQLFRNSFDLVGGLVQTRAPGEVLPVINDAVSKAELTSTLNEQSAQINEEIRQLRLDVMS